MKATVIHAPGDIRFEERPTPTIQQPGDAIVDVVATCVCGSDLWRYRGINEVKKPTPIGHEFVGRVREIGDDVTTVKPGDFVVGPFLASCGECPHCKAGMQSVCMNGSGYDGCQAEQIRVPMADGTLVATPEQPDEDLIPSLLTLSDVMGTGWHAAVSAGVSEGMTVAVVGDGAVGLCAIIAAKQLGASRIVAMSRHEQRQKLAREFGATDVVAERDDEGVAAIMKLTENVGADAVLECVGTAGAMKQALQACRPGGLVGFVGVPHDIEDPVPTMFARNVGLRGGMAPVRAYLPELLDLVLQRQIEPGKVFDMTLPLADVAEGYAAMDERRAIKVLLQP